MTDAFTGLRRAMGGLSGISPWNGVLVVVAVLVCGSTFSAASRAALSADELAELSAGLRFEAVALNPTTDPLGISTSYHIGQPDYAPIRDVAPGYQPIQSWISAVGATAALVDMDGSGLSDAICLVDPRDDSVRLYSVAAQLEGRADDGIVLDVPPPSPHRPTAPMGCIPGDLDDDGDQDLVVFFWGRPPLLFFGTGQPVTELRTEDIRSVELADPAEVWNTAAVNIGDLDGDGQLDLLAANYFPDGVLVLDPSGAGATPRMHNSMSSGMNGGTNRLLLLESQGADSLPRVTDGSDSLPSEAVGSWTLAIGFQDLDSDLLPEVYLANDFGPDTLLVNRSTPGVPEFEVVVGQRTLTTPKSQVMGRDSFKGMGVTFSLLDSGQDQSIVVSNITSAYALQESNLVFVPEGDGPFNFSDGSEDLGLSRSGWSWDVQAVDLDNDGWDELVQATGFLRGDTWRWPELQEVAMGNDGLLKYPEVWPGFNPGDDLSGNEADRLWIRSEDGRFYDVGQHVGFGSTWPSRGMAVGDLDGDSLADVVVANQWAPSVVYFNRSTAAHDAATIDIRYQSANGATTPAVGVRVSAEPVDDLPAFTRQVFPANGHSSAASPTVLLPLPSSGERQVTISWRSQDGDVHTVQRTIDSTQTVLLDKEGLS